MTKTLKQQILWFGPILLLWSMIVLPSCSHAVWGSLDDGANLTIAQAGASAALIIKSNAGRVCVSGGEKGGQNGGDVVPP